MKILQPNEVEKLSKEEISELYRKLYSLYIKARNSIAKDVLEAAKQEVRVETLKQQRQELREIASFLRGETDFRDISLGAKLTMRYLISVKHEWSIQGKKKEAVQMVLNFINAELQLREQYPEDLKTIKAFLDGNVSYRAWQDWEYEILKREDLTSLQKAFLIGRTCEAVKKMKARKK